MWITYIPMLLTAAISLTGLVLLIRGFYGQVVYHDPLCRKCRYNLTGRVSERCPECGSIVAEVGQVTSHRRRRWYSVLIGLVMLLPVVSGLWIGQRATRYLDGYHLKPTAWVFRDVNSDNPALTNRARWELESRLRHGDLSAAQVQQLTDLVFVMMTDKSWGQRQRRLGFGGMDIDAVLDSLIGGGHLSPAAFKRLFDATIKVDVRARPKAVRKYGIPVELGIKWTWLPYSVKTRPIVVLAAEDGTTPALPVFPIALANRLPDLGSCTDFSGLEDIHPVSGLDTQAHRSGTFVSFNGDHGQARELLAVKAETNGPTELRFVVCMDLFHQKGGAAPTPLYRLTRNVTLQSEVLDAPPPGMIELIRDPALGRRMKEAVKVSAQEVTSQNEGRGLSIGIEMTQLPANVAIEVLLKNDHVTDSGGTFIVRRAGDSLSLGVTRHDAGFLSGTTTVILKPAPELALRTVDIDRIWGEEMRFEVAPTGRKPVATTGKGE
ncbi:MAG: hypothetical protein GX616_12870 [Planctomycetes bacterium]|nr:hypothetical protein [Planctomycetota bacterium]